MKDLAKYIDHTILKADASLRQVETLCSEAVEYSFHSVCVNSCHVSCCSELLKDSSVKICSVAGFPLGAMNSEAKGFEAAVAISDGAHEIDMVINIGALKEGRTDYVLEDIRTVRKACARGIVLKVIIETCLLTDEEKKTACALALEAGADFVKTSTGFSTGGATEADVMLMKASSGGRMKVKASGGIKTYDDALRMIDAGADRLGTSSGIAIVKGA